MTAVRVIDDHVELNNAGAVLHSQLDSLVNSTSWVVLSGSAFATGSMRYLVAGTGISIVDNGPGGTLVLSSLSAPSPTSWMELPTGINDGINVTFQLAHVPNPPSALMFFVNGLVQEQGIGNDYSLLGSTVTLYQYMSGSKLRATYPY